MRVLAIDPGSEQSAFVVYEGGKILDFGIRDNAILIRQINREDCKYLAVEMIASYGMPVGETVFETCVWIGRFIQAWGGTNYTKIYRKEVKMALCGSMKAKDSNIRQAIMDRYGSTREKAIGTKKNPQALYGVSKDVWSALAVAITFAKGEI